MRVNGANSVSYTTSIQSKGNNQPAFGMNFSPEVITRFRECSDKLPILTMRKIKEINNRTDGFVLKQIGEIGDDMSGFDGIIRLSKDGKEFEKTWSLHDSDRMPNVISTAIEYLCDLPRVMKDFIENAKDVSAIQAEKVAENTERQGILSGLK